MKGRTHCGEYSDNEEVQSVAITRVAARMAFHGETSDSFGYTAKE
jgi:hypothetical protein